MVVACHFKQEGECVWVVGERLLLYFQNLPVALRIIFFSMTSCARERFCWPSELSPFTYTGTALQQRTRAGF